MGAAHPKAGKTRRERGQCSGFYRMQLGKFEFTALNDGVVIYPTTRVPPTATPRQIESRLSESGLTDPVGMSYNAYLMGEPARACARSRRG